jgi:aminopeptidase N
MRTEEPRAIRLEDYRPPDWLVETVELNVVLHAAQTRVQSLLHVKPNPQAGAPAPLVLDGDGLTLTAIKLDGALLPADEYVATPGSLTIPQPPNAPFRLEIETVIDPSANSQLMGLFRSSGTYCTQCEAEGFRRITYFPDRPDVMAVYTTRIEAEKAEAPVLLSNGNRIAAGDVPGTTRHYAVWNDPFPKPSYLFALVGGDLGCVEDAFVTRSGRKVTLQIYVEHGKEPRCAYAMDSLKRSMRWDEETFGREYDLDIFMIVAVSDFNMGAMENKGLNIFNDKYVLATAETATDEDYIRIEAIIAHEYFHNWTGNRITCRDWFQLCLKEGLTVFRDQEFTADERSRPVERIGDVRNLRTHQFVEDAGPMAHSVRPALYHEINNFYTTTIYEKGAEIVRMLKTLLGAEDFRRGMDLYFRRHDGHAATIEQFVACFAEVSSRDLTQFMRWYFQAGTPQVAASGRWDEAARSYRLDLVQRLGATPGQPHKEPMVIPLAIALLDPQGGEMPLATAEAGDIKRGVLVLDRPSQSFTFRDLPARPVPSINRGFSAPINLVHDLSAGEMRFLAAHDTDPFNRWQAIQTLAAGLLVASVAALRAGKNPRNDPGNDTVLTAALSAALNDTALEPAFIAQAIALPSEADIAREIGQNVDPDAIFRARAELRALLGRELGEVLRSTCAQMIDPGPYSPDAASAGRRALKNACLDLLTATAAADTLGRAAKQYADADNMTDRMAALVALAPHDVPERAAALEDFYRRFESDPLVIDKWFALQAGIPEAATLDRVQELTRHPAFSFGNPNRIRALVGTFALANPTQFNRADGRGYDFVIDTVLALDAKNPQVAARLMGAFKSWRALEPARRAHAESALRRVAAFAGLSSDIADLVNRALAPAPDLQTSAA